MRKSVVINMTHHEIYKRFKQGKDLNDISIHSLYYALKSNGAQVVLVSDKHNRLKLYNYVPETNRFYTLAKG